MNTLAIYPGTFDPVTTGHLDLIRRAREIFSHLIVAVADNAQKKALFTREERVEMLRQCTRNFSRVEVDSFSGLLVNYMRSCQAHVILRGLRAFSDFDYEYQLAQMNRKLYPEFEIVYMMPAERYTYISSSLAKEVAFLGGDISDLIPEEIRAYFLSKINEKSREEQDEKSLA